MNNLKNHISLLRHAPTNASVQKKNYEIVNPGGFKVWVLLGLLHNAVEN